MALSVVEMFIASCSQKPVLKDEVYSQTYVI